METMHAAGRRNLPPVPRPTAESPAERTIELRRNDEPEEVTSAAPAPDTLADDDTTTFPPMTDGDPNDGDPSDGDPTDGDPNDGDPNDGDPNDGDPNDGDPNDGDPNDGDPTDGDPTDGDQTDVDLPDPEVLAAADEPEVALEDDDPAQGFVSGLRAAAADFAAAAGAQTAVVREAVPPARHRRSRCRVVLRYADGAEADLTFLGSIGRPGSPAWEGFDRQIQQWLGDGQHRAAAWLVEDPEACDGMAVDVPAWLAAG